MILRAEQILLIEGRRADRPSFYTGLTQKGFEVVSLPSGKAALNYLETAKTDLVLIDAVSMRTNGRRICKTIHEQYDFIPIVLILEENSDNLDDFKVDVILVEPFTIQKLYNRIKPLLPANEKDLIRVGPFQLDVEQRWARCNRRHTQLTPRQVDLLRVLMDRPGQVIERTELFQKVWETEYTGDTRTLDVHISWLRQALEEDPRHPRYIKTVRGIGYRLDIEPRD